MSYINRIKSHSSANNQSVSLKNKHRCPVRPMLFGYSAYYLWFCSSYIFIFLLYRQSCNGQSKHRNSSQEGDYILFHSFKKRKLFDCPLSSAIFAAIISKRIIAAKERHWKSQQMGWMYGRKMTDITRLRWFRLIHSKIMGIWLSWINIQMCYCMYVCIKLWHNYNIAAEVWKENARCFHIGIRSHVNSCVLFEKLYSNKFELSCGNRAEQEAPHPKIEGKKILFEN